MITKSWTINRVYLAITEEWVIDTL